MYCTLISAGELAALVADPSRAERLLIADCRASLADPDAGRAAYDAGHVPGAVHLSLETDLSGPPVTNAGRHPLPTDEALAALFSRLGVTRDTQIVAYDADGGAFAARLWWLARYAGIECAAVLDGGLPAWEAEGRPLTDDVPVRSPGDFGPSARAMPLVTLEAIVPGTSELVDARDPARYRGEVEPIDPRAGHIPGALNHPFKANLDAAGRFLPGEEIGTRLTAALGRPPSAATIHYCGSGVTACHNVLAQVLAGFPAPILYAGSFSEWCRDPDRPVAP